MIEDDPIVEQILEEARDDVVEEFDGRFPIEIEGLRNSFGDQVIHEDLDLQVQRGEILGVVGGSGTGKSVLMRSIIGLQIPDAGEVRVFGKNTIGAEPDEESAVRSRWLARLRPSGSSNEWVCISPSGALHSISPSMRGKYTGRTTPRSRKASR